MTQHGPSSLPLSARGSAPALRRGETLNRYVRPDVRAAKVGAMTVYPVGEPGKVEPPSGPELK